MRKNYVIFFSPGTFVSEQTSEEIDSWDVDKAIEMSRKIKERYGATPYGFQFVTRERNRNDFDSKETKRSSMYYLGGEILTLEQVRARKDSKDRILISNMEFNNHDRVIVNNNSYRTVPLEKDDVVLDYAKSGERE